MFVYVYEQKRGRSEQGEEGSVSLRVNLNNVDYGNNALKTRLTYTLAKLQISGLQMEINVPL